MLLCYITTHCRDLLMLVGCRDFIQRNNSTIDEVYYTRAVDNGETSFTFSVPFNPGRGYKSIINEAHVTSFVPVINSSKVYQRLHNITLSRPTAWYYFDPYY